MNRLSIALAIASTCFAVEASAQTVLFSDSFENGLGNWSATGLWGLASTSDPCGSQLAPFPEGTWAAYYGIGGPCNFDTGSETHGQLTLLAPIAIPAGVPAVSLHCWTYHQHEPCVGFGGFDSFNISLSTNGGASWRTIGRSCYLTLGVPSLWQPRGIDLSECMGQSILLSFDFATIDGFYNAYFGALVDKLEVRVEAGTPFCTSICPCAGAFNTGPPMNYGDMTGCANSAHLQGELAGQGTPSVANDSVVLHATELVPNTIAIFLEADTHSNGAFSGDGRACLTGALTTLATRTTTNGSVRFPAAGDPPLSVAGAVAPGGGTKHYQVLYRDNGAYCTSAKFNLTNGYTITWSP